MRRAAGFSLLEVVVVLVLVGVLATVSTQLLRQPIDASNDVQRRARLADAADQAMARISRDIRLALPNSVRVNATGTAIEFLMAPAGGRYRAAPTAAGSGDVLDFATADASFDVLSPLAAAPQSGQWVVIYNLGAEGPQANAWRGDNRATVGAGSTPSNIVLAPPFRFPFPSPTRRFYLVSGAVQYACTADGRLMRFAGYPPAAAMLSPPAGGTSGVLADAVGLCEFRYAPGAGSRNALVTLRLAVERDGERVTLLKSVHLPNAP
jgi:MSHA biogenesis protein MshO